MINKLKLAIVSEDFEELKAFAEQMEISVKDGYLNTLSTDELVELQALYKQALDILQVLRKKDLEKIKKLKKSLKYANNFN